MLKQISNIATCVLFALLIFLSLVYINHQPGKVSEQEGRELADFPTIIDSSGALNSNLKSDFTKWLDDNIGLRDNYVAINANLKLRLLNQSSSEDVKIDKDGWLFYTGDNNIDIAKGTYPLTDGILLLSANSQQTVSDYYKARNVNYLLLINPSKVSIYPEFIDGGDYLVGRSPVDIMEDYLLQNTDINVVNSKGAILDAKPEGKVFWKTDTHWTPLGSYQAYTALLKEMNDKGITDGAKPIEVTIREIEINGELPTIMGDPELLGPESGPDTFWDESFTYLKSGEMFDRASQLVGSRYHPTILSNPSAQNGTLLIYGDSMMSVRWKLPCYLAEHFKYVVVVNMSDGVGNTNLEDYLKPDLVLFDCGERKLTNRLLDVTKMPPFQTD